MMGFFKEFKEFAMRGNVVDMAVGIIIGAAFGKIVTALVNDIVMPPIGMMLGNVDFTKLAIILREGTEDGSITPVAINYGIFINTVLDFLIVAFAIFIVIKQINRLKRSDTGAPQAPSLKKCPYCKSDIDINATRCPMCTSDLQPATA